MLNTMNLIVVEQRQRVSQSSPKLAHSVLWSIAIGPAMCADESMRRCGALTSERRREELHARGAEMASDDDKQDESETEGRHIQHEQQRNKQRRYLP